MKIYIASSCKNIHAVKLLTKQLTELGHEILDWTKQATPPHGLTVEDKRKWFNEHDAKKVFEFCSSACAYVDVVVYLGQSGQDSGVEIGIAYASGVPIIGIRGMLEDVGLMLNGAVTIWIDSPEALPEQMKKLGKVI